MTIPCPLLLAGLLGVLSFPGAAMPAPAAERLRLIVETDAGGDPDDEQSLVRFLLYASEWDIEGIIANRAAARPGENRNVERTGLGIVGRLLTAYGQCWTNLVRHDTNFPAPWLLRDRAVAGYNDTDAAVRLLMAAVDRQDPRPLWYSDWGTDHGAATNNLRRALDRVRLERGPAGYAAFKSRLRLSSYDAFGAHTFEISPAFPLWVNTFQPAFEGKRWYHRFSALTSRAGGFDLVRDALTGHGPLGALYPTNTTHWAKEGDSMSFIHLLPTGMNAPEQPAWGGWAGRYGLNTNAPGRAYYWACEADAWQGATHRDHTLARWAEALQNDFRARLDWCVADDFRKANHRPRAALNGDTGREFVCLEAKPGERVRLSALGSRDPDGHRIRARWTVYPECGTFRGRVELETAEGETTGFTAPEVRAPSTIHVILEVADEGSPRLFDYRRAIVTVKP